MGSLEKIDNKNFVIKIKTSEITGSARSVQFSHLDCWWMLSYHQNSDFKRVYMLYCLVESDSELWNIDTSVTFSFSKQDGTKGITRSINTCFHSLTDKCKVKVSNCLPDFNAIYPNVEVHVKINSVTGFQREPRYSNFEKDEQLSDVALVVEGKKLYANKAVLATLSPVFRAMFFSGFKESTDKEVVIKDAKYENFLNFLQVMHDAYSKICYENVQSLLVLADRYDVGVVMEKCDNYFVSPYTGFTNSEHANLADTYKLSKLHKRCTDSIDRIRSMAGEIDNPTDSCIPITEDHRKTVMEFDKEDDQLSDFAFVFEGKKLYVNKAVLATFSPVFRAMFFPGFKESIDKEMTITDINDDDFEQFLQVMHTAYPSINDMDIESILALADRYKVDIVMEKCEDYLLCTDKGDNADKLRFAETYSFPKLHEKVMESIAMMDGLTSICYDEGRFGPMTLQAIIQKMVIIEDDRVAEENRFMAFDDDDDYSEEMHSDDDL